MVDGRLPKIWANLHPTLVTAEGPRRGRLGPNPLTGIAIPALCGASMPLALAHRLGPGFAAPCGPPPVCPPPVCPGAHPPMACEGHPGAPR
jgi:hypothetical protein